MNHPSVICLTPVRNEAWILRRFLQCASLWADHIVVADQGSDDGSAAICREFEKVILIDNSSSDFNEPERQKLLLDAARELPGPRLLIALDADECLTASFLSSPEWQTVLHAQPGTVIRFRLVNLRPDMESYWSPPCDFPMGFMDDGSNHQGQRIHSPKVPISSRGPGLTLRDVRVLHYQFTHWERMLSKHRWYQCWERVHRADRRAVAVFREYHHMNSIPDGEIRKLPAEWLRGYIQHGVDMTSISEESVFWWDRAVLGFFRDHGAARFAREDVWQVDWNAIAAQVQAPGLPLPLSDPRGRVARLVHRWLRWSQACAGSPAVRRVDKLLGIFGW